MKLLDSCNGLILLSCRRRLISASSFSSSHKSAPDLFYVVCNPTTHDWVELPEDPRLFSFNSQDLNRLQELVGPQLQFCMPLIKNQRRHCAAALAFDPVVSSHFHVLLLGRLLFVYADFSYYLPELSIYALETTTCDDGAEKWILKQRVKELDPSGMWFKKQHSVVAVHPHCNVIFLFDNGTTRKRLMACDMDHKTTRIVCNLNFPEASSSPNYNFFPYIPPRKEAVNAPMVAHELCLMPNRTQEENKIQVGSIHGTTRLRHGGTTCDVCLYGQILSMEAHKSAPK
ncbi:hypothetical protein PR202_gb03745 [Eleusine coracana subsp. coracana]|uniref:F-box protein n=1 Tax=Eleusine coracana subsp. coracana TaxID=191504 RepID=A0AAV5E2N8_ELECO|nr:hypothetical protein PR202_gb03745 [Eleusine coracana subsp. coracana]